MSKIDIEQLADEAYPLKEGYNSFEYSIAFKNRAAFVKGYQKATEAQKQPAMSLEECKDVVFQELEYDDYKHYIASPFDSEHDDFDFHLRMLDKASELYANQFREAQKCQCHVLRLEETWPLIDVLRKLVEASDILLHEKDYDRAGWEEHEYAYRQGLMIIEQLNQPMYPKEAP